MSIARACKRCQARIRELEAGLLGCRQARSELEAELATERQAGQIELGQRIAWRIRAEKAETDARESLRLVRFLEARIAELEEALAAASPSGETPTQWGERIALKAAREARERE